MSRYTRRFGQVEFAYGYDHMLGDYFFDKADISKATEDNDEGYVYQISSSMSLMPHPDTPSKHDYSKSEILEIVIKEEELLGKEIMTEEHKMALATDLTF